MSVSFPNFALLSFPNECISTNGLLAASAVPTSQVCKFGRGYMSFLLEVKHSEFGDMHSDELNGVVNKVGGEEGVP